jgi:hypothetical protein
MRFEGLGRLSCRAVRGCTAPLGRPRRQSHPTSDMGCPHKKQDTPATGGPLPAGSSMGPARRSTTARGDDLGGDFRCQPVPCWLISPTDHPDNIPAVPDPISRAWRIPSSLCPRIPIEFAGERGDMARPRQPGMGCPVPGNAAGRGAVAMARWRRLSVRSAGLSRIPQHSDLARVLHVPLATCQFTLLQLISPVQGLPFRIPPAKGHLSHANASRCH